MSRIDLRLDYWPMVITVLPEEVTEAALVPYFNSFLSSVLGKREKFVSVVDAMAVSHAPSARVRQRIAEWEDLHMDLGVQYNLGIAIATSSVLVRGAMTAIHWVVPPRVPTTFEPTVSDAVDWAVKRLEHEGIRLPPLVRAYGAKSAAAGGR